MPSEKLTILKMLEEGKLTAEEAARLLEAAAAPTRSTPSAAPPRDVPGSNQGGYYAYSSNTMRADGGAYRDRPDRPGNNGASPHPTSSSLENIAQDIGRKFEAFARDVEPRLQNLSERIVEGTVNLADRISRGLESSSAAAPSHGSQPRTAPTGGPYSPRSTTSTGDFVRAYEMQVAEGFNELTLRAHNGIVLIHGYNGDKISATVTYKPKHPSAHIELTRLGNRYFLDYEQEDFRSVGIDAYIPESMFNLITLETNNGAMDISTITADTINIANNNGPIKLKSTCAHALAVDNTNGGMSIDYVRAENAKIDNCNGTITTLDADCANLSMSNVNGAISVNVSQFAAYNNYLWDMETSNSKITLNLPTSPGVGYHAKARTSLGSVRMGLTNMNYITNAKSVTEAKTIGFDECGVKVKLALETSNGAININ
ncbi:MAG: DUF4097 family beta strand repeat-containing protein [Clostridiales bacterium]|nr:DUF4097 family beta strand repeat-containing protein [Clostridiales bacterium]